jgi:hypothetical protein
MCTGVGIVTCYKDKHKVNRTCFESQAFVQATNLKQNDFILNWTQRGSVASIEYYIIQAIVGL